MANLANNHILDHGIFGLKSTLSALREAGVVSFGAGTNLAAAQRFVIATVGRVRIAFVGMAEHEWSIAAREQPGAAPLDVLHFVREAEAQRNDFDFLVALLHAGAEHYPYPTPALQDTARFLVERGAVLVLCQHSHCVGCAEQYKNGLIIYGQGNLLFAPPSASADGRALPDDRQRSWATGFWVEASLTMGEPVQTRFHFFEQSAATPGLRMLSAEEERTVQTGFDQRSAELSDFAAIQRRWEDFCQPRTYDLLAKTVGHSYSMRRLTRRPWVFSRLYSGPSLRQVCNVVRCQTHREMLLTAFENYWRHHPSRSPK